MADRTDERSTLDSLRLELDSLDPRPAVPAEEALGGAIPAAATASSAADEPADLAAFTRTMRQSRTTQVMAQKEQAMSSEWLAKGQQRVAQAEAELATHHKNIESSDASQSPETLRAALDAAQQRHEAAHAFNRNIVRQERRAKHCSRETQAVRKYWSEFGSRPRPAYAGFKG
jgi:hypothetical protein